MAIVKRVVLMGPALAFSAAHALPAGAQRGSGPEGLIAAFEATCRAGFPDLEAVRRVALADGWTDAQVRLVGGDSNFRNALAPQVLRKDGFTLFLTRPNAIGMKHGCQVAGPADRSLDIDALSSAASAAMALGSPAFSRGGGAELAQWRPDAASIVQASLNRRPRSASLQVRLER